MHPAIKFLSNLDRRWIFLVMAVSVMTPIACRMQFPESPGPLAQKVFDKIEALPNGSKILFAFDYDPGSAPELQPMATAMVWHAATKGHKLYFMALWPLGANMIKDTVDQVLKKEFPHYTYGEDYVNLGFKPGNEGVINVVASNLKELYTTDHYQTSIDDIPLTKNFANIREVDLICNISAGYPGTKEWIQYGATPLGIEIVSGCTGVQSPLLYPYIPTQLQGLLGAIKGAAEYEAAIKVAYPEYADKPEHLLGIRRMGPQLIAHCTILTLIILGNVVLFISRRSPETS